MPDFSNPKRSAQNSAVSRSTAGSTPPAPPSQSSAAPSPPRFDLRSASAFVNKSLSDNTRRTYQRALQDFFRFVHDKHPTAVLPADVLAWRDELILKRKLRPATVAFKLAVLRSFFAYLTAAGTVPLNPAAARLVTPPAVPESAVGRALTPKEVRNLLAGPDKATASGARDYALLLVLLRLGLRVAEACALRVADVKWSHGRWIVKCKVKGGRERTLPVPPEVKGALDVYLKLDAERRRQQRSDGAGAWLFQPLVNYRTLEFDRGLSVRMAWNVVRKWADYGGVGKVSPHDLRRTAITRALELGLTIRQVQMMSGHRDPKTVLRYDRGRGNLEQNAVNFLSYDEA